VRTPISGGLETSQISWGIPRCELDDLSGRRPDRWHM
jgi:hypothetical protein